MIYSVSFQSDDDERTTGIHSKLDLSLREDYYSKVLTERSLSISSSLIAAAAATSAGAGARKGCSNSVLCLSVSSTHRAILFCVAKYRSYASGEKSYSVMLSGGKVLGCLGCLG